MMANEYVSAPLLRVYQRKMAMFSREIADGNIGIMREMGNVARDVTIARTESGIDLHGKRFTKLSKKYAAWKALKVGVGYANMKLFGDMLAAIQVDAWKDKARVYITGDLQYVKAIVHNSGGRSGRGTGFKMPKREFFGAPKRERDIKQIRSVFVDFWTKRAKYYGLL